MPKWIWARPEQHSNFAERRVAEKLNRVLPDDWLVCWGYFYPHRKSTREGDFLVLGPRGGLLVIEVKGGELRHLPQTGQWMAGNRLLKGNPLDQLMDQYGGVQNIWRRHARKPHGSPRLHIDKVIALPDVEIDGMEEQYSGIARGQILDKNDLAWFSQWWAGRFRDVPVPDSDREWFIEHFAATSKPTAVRSFVSHSEQVFRHQCLANFDLLDMLEENRQIVVHGGAGTGKTWHAIVKATRLARAGKSPVLLLCYNLALAKEIRSVIERDRAARGTAIDVMAWEELATALTKEAGLDLEPPAADADREQQIDFYDRQVPVMMANAIDNLTGTGALPCWRALVVDEAQDHNTGGTSDWWDLYFRLLNDGRSSEMALFYDCAQRPVFRRGSFVIEDLVERMNHPVKVRLPRPLRYTWPVIAHLRGLTGAGVDDLVAGLGRNDDLPPGPPVIEEAATGREDALSRLERIIVQWREHGYCQPWDILIIHRRRTLDDSFLANVHEIAGARLCPWDEVPPTDAGANVLRHVSANRAKGLDSLAVIVIDFEPFSADTEPGWQASYFMACSRARQLLAVIATPK